MTDEMIENIIKENLNNYLQGKIIKVCPLKASGDKGFIVWSLIEFGYTYKHVDNIAIFFHLEDDANSFYKYVIKNLFGNLV